MFLWSFLKSKFWNEAPPNPDFEDLRHFGYNIQGQIGEGGFSKVFKGKYGTENCTSVQLACKVLKNSESSPTFVEELFGHEVHILKQLHHPNIIEIHSIMQRGPEKFICLRLAENGDLIAYLNERGPLSELRAKVWFYQLADAVEYLHSRDIAHCDIKCDNILISGNCNIKLADFGHACNCRDDQGREILLRKFGGTKLYAAPEVHLRQPYYPKMADAWSSGIVLFTMLNAKLPFKEENTVDLACLQFNKNFTFDRNLQLSMQARDTVAALLEPEPTLRWKVRQILDCNWLQTD